MQEIILNIDIAPTLVDLAGATQAIADGQSFKSLLIDNDDSMADPMSKWRTEFLVEHDGEHKDIINECPHLNYQNVAVSLSYDFCGFTLYCTVRFIDDPPLQRF